MPQFNENLTQHSKKFLKIEVCQQGMEKMHIHQPCYQCLMMNCCWMILVLTSQYHQCCQWYLQIQGRYSCPNSTLPYQNVNRGTLSTGQIDVNDSLNSTHLLTGPKVTDRCPSSPLKTSPGISSSSDKTQHTQ